VPSSRRAIHSRCIFANYEVALQKELSQHAASPQSVSRRCRLRLFRTVTAASASTIAATIPSVATIAPTAHNIRPSCLHQLSRRCHRHRQHLGFHGCRRHRLITLEQHNKLDMLRVRKEIDWMREPWHKRRARKRFGGGPA